MLLWLRPPLREALFSTMAAELWEPRPAFQGPGGHSGLGPLWAQVSTKKRPSSPSTEPPPDLRLPASRQSPLNHCSAAGLERNAPEPWPVHLPAAAASRARVATGLGSSAAPGDSGPESVWRPCCTASRAGAPTTALRTCDAPTCGAARGASRPAGSEAVAAGNPAPERGAASFPPHAWSRCGTAASEPGRRQRKASGWGNSKEGVKQTPSRV